MDTKDLEDVERMMAYRDNSFLLSEESKRLNMLGLADAVPGLMNHIKAQAQTLDSKQSECDGLIADLVQRNQRVEDLLAEVERLKAALGPIDKARQDLILQVRDLKDALNRDKTGLATALAGVIEEVKARRWVVDGRGDYAFDDDRYRKETGWALDAIEKIAEAALAASGKIAYEALVTEHTPSFGQRDRDQAGGTPPAPSPTGGTVNRVESPGVFCLTHKKVMVDGVCPKCAEKRVESKGPSFPCDRHGIALPCPKCRAASSYDAL